MMFPCRYTFLVLTSQSTLIFPDSSLEVRVWVYKKSEVDVILLISKIQRRLLVLSCRILLYQEAFKKSKFNKFHAKRATTQFQQIKQSFHSLENSLHPLLPKLRTERKFGGKLIRHIACSKGCWEIGAKPFSQERLASVLTFTDVLKSSK